MSNTNGLFIHIPKTAGKTLKMSLKKHFQVAEGKHSTLRYIQKKNPNILSKPLITCIRNPWERIWSLYNYTHRIGYHKKSFDTWLYEPVVNGRYKHYQDTISENPLVSKNYLMTDSGEVPEGLFVIHFENLKNDFKEAKKYFKLPDLSLHPNNHDIRNLGRGYKKNITPKQVDYIYEICSWEIETFGYEF